MLLGSARVPRLRYRLFKICEKNDGNSAVCLPGRATCLSMSVTGLPSATGLHCSVIRSTWQCYRFTLQVYMGVLQVYMQ